MSAPLGDEGADSLCFDLIAHIPREQVISMETTLPILRSEELCTEMCDLTHLHLVDVDLFEWFTEPEREPHALEGLLHSLDCIEITRATLHGDWIPLMNFLSNSAAVGNRISSLKLSGHFYIDEGLIESIQRAVDIFEYDDGEETANNLGI